MATVVVMTERAITGILSIAAFAMGFYWPLGDSVDEELHSTEVMIGSGEPSKSTVSEEAGYAENADGELPLPEDILTHIEFDRFDRETLRVTSEARCLLQLTPAEVSAIEETLRQHADAVIQYEAENITRSQYFPDTANETHYEIKPDAKVISGLRSRFQSSASAVVGPDRARLLMAQLPWSVPLDSHTVYLKYNTSGQWSRGHALIGEDGYIRNSFLYSIKQMPSQIAQAIANLEE